MPISDPADSASYTVVARRYRPQRFVEVVGQDHVVQSLRNALRLNKVTHAYLFSGTRGVGKTSVARIFAKCLNCVRGPTEDPCLVCDICQLIAVGQDVDVIEIDGASNNGVEAVRELRQNASLRPSRARYKIYYIDEVHMLSTGAFNALLKTLEEPPGHVKFFFATTEPNKIPITVLSRCQKYDFAGITPEQIVATLAEICARERIEAEPEALRTVARRAGGSMRDAQSLLEQLLSAGGQRLTVEVVHRLLGTASDERLLDLIDALADRDVAGALRQLDGAAGEGVQPVDVLNGLLEFLRDVMVLATGAEATLLAATPRQVPRLQAVVDRWTLDSVLAGLQILAEARGRLRGSSHSRLLVELALARVARLENLGEIGDLIGRLAALESGGGTPPSNTAPGVVKKKLAAVESLPDEPPPREPPSRESAPVLAPNRDGAAPPDIEDVRRAWKELPHKVGVRLGVGLSQVEPSAILAPDILVVSLGAGYNWVANECGAPEARAKIEQALQQLLHRPMTIRFATAEGGDEPATASTPSPPPPAPSGRALLEEDPMVRKVVELFEARPVHLEVEEDATRPSRS